MATRTKRPSKPAAGRTVKRSKGRAAHAPRPIETEDLLCFVGLGDPQMSPDGSRVAFVRTVANEDAKLETSIWTADVGAAPSQRALTRGTKDAMPRFSPDSRTIAFVRAVEGRAVADGIDAALVAAVPAERGIRRRVDVCNCALAGRLRG